MTTVFLSAIPDFPQFLPGSNTPAAGAQLFCYKAGTSTKQDMYVDNTGVGKFSNPLVLDAGGNPGGTNEIWIPSGLPAKFVLAPSNDTDPPTSPYFTWDNVSGINDTSLAVSEWVTGPAPTFVSSTQFTVAGDQTTVFTPGRRIKATVTAGTIYGTVITSAFGALTTVTIAGGALDSGLSAVSYGLLDPANPSIDFYHVDRQASAVLAATATTNVWGTDGNSVHLSSSVTIGSFSTAPYVGALKKVIADAPFTLQNSSTTLLVPGGMNKTVAVGDSFDVYADTLTKMRIINYSATSGASATLQNYLSGLTISVANSTDTVSTAAGCAMDSANSTLMTLPAQMNKTAASWAASSGSGGLLDAGTVSTLAWYHWHLMQRSDNGWVDIGFSSSAAAPPLPAGYGVSRRFASTKTNAASTWAGVTQQADTFLYTSSFADVTANIGSAATSTFALTTPLNVVTEALCMVAATSAVGVYVFPLSSIAEVVGPTKATLRSSAGGIVGPHRVFTNASSQIATIGESGVTIVINTYGYVDTRGKK